MIYLDKDKNIPLYEQIYENIKNKIIDGYLKNGMKLKSIRYLAKELNISINTVETAYEHLIAEGYIISKPRVGYIVNYLNNNIIEEGIDNHEDGDYSKEDNIEYDFSYGSLKSSHFPTDSWKKYLTETLQEDIVNNNSKGDIELRNEIRDYLYISRGVKSTIEEVIICNNTQEALEIINRINPFNDRNIGIENPCYHEIKAVFENNDYNIIPIPVGKDGIDVDYLNGINVNMVFVSPSHQFPMGSIMSYENRIKLLNWARKNKGFIIEDDYDNEFNYKNSPIPSLQSMDEDENVIYIGTFSKTISPGVSIAYLILPKSLIKIYEKRFKNYKSAVSLLNQKIVGKFIKNGDWDRYVRKINTLHRKKHDILIDEIENIFKDKVKIYGENSGLHIILEFSNGEIEEDLIKKSSNANIKIDLFSNFWHEGYEKEKCFIILGYGKIELENISEAVKKLYEVWFK